MHYLKYSHPEPIREDDFLGIDKATQFPDIMNVKISSFHLVHVLFCLTCAYSLPPTCWLNYSPGALSRSYKSVPVRLCLLSIAGVLQTGSGGFRGLC